MISQLFIALQQSFAGLQEMTVQIINNLEESNHFVDQQLLMLPFDKDLNIKSDYQSSTRTLTNSLNKKQELKRPKRTYLRSTRSQINQQIQKESIFSQILPKRQRGRPKKILKTKVNEEQVSNAVNSPIYSLIKQSSAIERYFMTDFQEQYEFVQDLQFTVPKSYLREVFVNWMKQFPNLVKEADFNNISMDDCMLIQRQLTYYIKRNFSSKCKIKGTVYAGMRQKRAWAQRNTSTQNQAKIKIDYYFNENGEGQPNQQKINNDKVE